MWASKETIRAYYADWRKSNKDKMKEYKRRHKSKQKITSIINFGNTKYFKERLIGSDRCQLCEIIIGKGYEEEKFYKLRDKKVCYQCYKEAHERNHKN